MLEAYVAELSKLREENERLRSAAGAHDVLKSIYLDPDAPQGNRIKAATAALQHETPRLLPEKAAIDSTCEEIVEPIAVRVERERARMERILALPLEARSALFSGVALEPGSNGGNGSGDSSTD